MTKILVTGIGGPAGKAISAMLLERGYEVAGTDMQRLALESIRFHQVPAAREPGFLEALYQAACEEQADLVIPTVSEELPVVAQGWKWSQAIPAMIANAPAVTTANDKYLTARALVQAGVATPRFMLPSQAGAPEAVAAAVGWPCISKPRVGRGGREVTLHEASKWADLARLDDRYILQEFAPGTDYAPNVFLNDGGEGIAIVLEKTELKEGILGNALQVQRVLAEDVAQTALQAGRAAGLTGAMDIDIRRRGDGTPVVLEINARFGANSRHAPEVLEAALRCWLPEAAA